MKEREREDRGSFEEPRRKLPLASNGSSGFGGLRAEQLVPTCAHRRDELGGGGGAEGGAGEARGNSGGVIYTCRVLESTWR